MLVLLVRVGVGVDELGFGALVGIEGGILVLVLWHGLDLGCGLGLGCWACMEIGVCLFVWVGVEL